MAVVRHAIVLLLTVAICNCTQPAFFDCANSNQCNKGECCTIGRQRFSLPTCRRLGTEDDYCYPGRDGEPFNTTLEYPNGAKLDVVNIYQFFCPCQIGFVCDVPSHRCQPDSGLDDNLQ